MNLCEITQHPTEIKQDTYSTSGVVYGRNLQIKVFGWCGKNGSNKIYVVKCAECSKDPELHGEGYFKILKKDLIAGIIPCGCSSCPKWSRKQFAILCDRKATSLGYYFVGFADEWNGAHTKIRMRCSKHGEWTSGNINNLLNSDRGCSECMRETAIRHNRKPDSELIDTFLRSGSFVEGTQFWRSERTTRGGRKLYWCVSCPVCGVVGESFIGNLQKGQRPCACSKHRQQECYINFVYDNDNLVAVKFGVARDSGKRLLDQNRKSHYQIVTHQVYKFQTSAACKNAERLCKQRFVCGVVSKTDMTDGFTETTHASNIKHIREIYESCGGILQ